MFSFQIFIFCHWIHFVQIHVSVLTYKHALTLCAATPEVHRWSRLPAEEALASGDKDAATAALRAAQPELMRGVTKGVFHKNTASRKISRLSSRVKSLG
mgnify:CR=1 FL=1